MNYNRFFHNGAVGERAARDCELQSIWLYFVCGDCVIGCDDDGFVYGYNVDIAGIDYILVMILLLFLTMIIFFITKKVNFHHKQR